MNRILMSAALLAAAAAGGCYKNTYTTGQPIGGATHTVKANFFIYGLIGETTVNVDALCPNGVAWFQNRMDVPDALLSCITCSLYTPLTIEVRCASGQAWLAVPDDEESMTWIFALDEEGEVAPFIGETAQLSGGAL